MAHLQERKTKARTAKQTEIIGRAIFAAHKLVRVGDVDNPLSMYTNS
jgi:hypothetical protein